MKHIAIGLTLLAGASIMADAAPVHPKASLNGLWGGDRMQLTMDAHGGRIEMDCASGTISGPVQLKADGSFTARGTFERYQGGPQRADEGAAPARAQFRGKLGEGVMQLAVTPVGVKASQIFLLRQGARVKLIRCL